MPTQTLSEAMAGWKTRAGQNQLVANWRDYVPHGSRWRPGDVGEPECPACKGIGYVRVNLPVGHPDFGKLFVCDCAAEKVSAARAAKLQKASEMHPDDLSLEWGSIAMNSQIAEAVRASRVALERGYGWLYLWGPPGPGKTLLLKCIVAEAIRVNKGAVYAMWPDVLDHLRRGYAVGDYDTRLENWRTTPILAVDEFGRAQATEWAAEAQVKIFNARYETGVGRRTLTVFASNFSPDQAEPWFADRLHDGRFQIVELRGPSMRPLMESEA